MIITYFTRLLQRLLILGRPLKRVLRQASAIYENLTLAYLVHPAEVDI
jgi:hypothetical protein